MGLYDYNIYDFICRNAQMYAERDCIVFKNSRLSFREYKNKCDSLAAGLIHSGIKKGDRVGIVAQNSDEFMILYGAVAKIGAILLPVNWRFQQDEVEYVLNDCTPKIVFAGPEYRESILDAAAKIDSIEKCYSIGGEASAGFTPFDDLFEDGGEEEIDVPMDSGYVIIHTAAVEGHPRGALLSQGNIVYGGLQTINQYVLGPEDCHICILPLFHIAGLSLAMSVMYAGGKNVIVERFDPELTLSMMDKEKGTTFFHFPPILKMLLDKYGESSAEYDLSSMRNVGGIDHPDNILGFKKIAPNTNFWTAFVQTEAMPVTSALMQEKPGSAGRPSLLAKVALFDDYDKEVPVGTPGEICVRSPVVFLGYWGRDEDNAYTFRNGWHHTGDVGRFDEEGYLFYVKRKAQKELIKPGGENVYPAEVEKVILGHESVAEVSVIGVPDKQWGEAIKAVCVLEAGKILEPEILAEFVASKIARYKKPKYVVFVDSLPKKEDGEIDRDQVKQDHGGKF